MSACRRADRLPVPTGSLRAGTAVLLCALLGAGCATPSRTGSPTGRLPGETPVAIAQPATPPLSVSDIVALHRAGASADKIVARWREDGARTRFSVGDFFDLRARGVPLATLEALLDAREAALRTDGDSRLAALQSRYENELAAERARPAVCPSPWPGYPFQPFGGWHRGPRGGLYWGW